MLYPLSYGGVLAYQYSKCTLEGQGELAPMLAFGEPGWSEVSMALVTASRSSP